MLFLIKRAGGLTAAETVFALIAEPPEADTGTVGIERARGGIRFEHVTKRYNDDGPAALDDIDLDIAPGESVALVGPSGGGKTTLVNLLPRFFDHTEGRVTIDGVDIRDLRLANLRELISLVTQKTILYYITVRQGDLFNEEQLRRDFHVLWTTGFFSDIKMDRLASERGVIVLITVKENPVVSVSRPSLRATRPRSGASTAGPTTCTPRTRPVPMPVATCSQCSKPVRPASSAPTSPPARPPPSGPRPHRAVTWPSMPRAGRRGVPSSPPKSPGVIRPVRPASTVACSK